MRVREGVWRVVEVRTPARSPDVRTPMQTRVLKLLGADALNRWQPCTLLEPFDRPRRVEAAHAPRVVSRARWMRTCAALVATSPPSGCPATIADARATLLPHQIDPVLAVLRGRASRLLLADAVGLGKTIQAALLVRELRARGCADRVLILVPSGLREQWRQELSHRTGLRAEIIDAASLAARARDLPPDVNPWSLPGILIVSLDFIKQPAVLHGASAIVWDILIADEAHNLNEGTDRLAAADLLARHSRHVALLTATPHHGSDDAFAALCRIGHIGRIRSGGSGGRIGQPGSSRDPHGGRQAEPIGHIDIDAEPDANLPDAVGGSSDMEAGVPASELDADVDPIAIFRRTRQTMGLALSRKVRVLRVTPTKQERRLHMLLARYAGRVEREQGGDTGDVGGCGGNGTMNGEGARSAGGVSPGEVSPGATSMAAASLADASLAMSILLKRASSSAWSLERSLRRRLALLDGRVPATADQSRTQVVLPFTNRDADAGADADDVDDDTDVGDGEPSRVLGAPGLRSARIERAWLTLLIEASRNASRGESKPRALARLVRRCREPVLIYTEYRDTLTHLARTLASVLAGTPTASSSLVMLHGGLGADERRGALARFTSGDARVLLTTDAAGEGLNLHHRCRLVVNVELPWNPNRLEQRIGRLDRLGQTRTVHAIHLVAANTAEEPMLARLTARLTQIAATLGDAPAVLRAWGKAVFPDTGGTQTTDAGIADSRARVQSSVARNEANAPDSSDTDLLAEDAALSAGDACGVCRSISSEAVDVTAQLQRLRAMRARAWRVGRHHSHGASSSRGDPLLTLDERAPLIAVIRAARFGGAPAQRLQREHLDQRRVTRARHEDDARRPRASAVAEPRSSSGHELPAYEPSPHELSPNAPSAHELSIRGLLCIWRTRLEGDDGQVCGRRGPPSQVLTAIHVACDVPSFAGRKAVTTFVSATLDRCGARIGSLLDNELAVARRRLHTTGRGRIERLAKRDDAIAGELASMLRARADSGGMFQPLLFEDIATDRSTTTGATDVNYCTRAPVAFEADVRVNCVETANRAPSAAWAADAAERTESTLVMALVLR